MFHTQMVINSTVYLLGGWCSQEINIRAFPIMKASISNLDKWDAIYLPELYCENPGVIRFGTENAEKFLIFGEE